MSRSMLAPLAIVMRRRPCAASTGPPAQVSASPHSATTAPAASREDDAHTPRTPPPPPPNRVRVTRRPRPAEPRARAKDAPTGVALLVDPVGDRIDVGVRVDALRKLGEEGGLRVALAVLPDVGTVRRPAVREQRAEDSQRAEGGGRRGRRGRRVWVGPSQRREKGRLGHWFLGRINVERRRRAGL
eukprot:7376434-Prymnesium_polylepis.1